MVVFFWIVRKKVCPLVDVVWSGVFWKRSQLGAGLWMGRGCCFHPLFFFGAGFVLLFCVGTKAGVCNTHIVALFQLAQAPVVPDAHWFAWCGINTGFCGYGSGLRRSPGWSGNDMKYGDSMRHPFPPAVFRTPGQTVQDWWPCYYLHQLCNVLDADYLVTCLIKPDLYPDFLKSLHCTLHVLWNRIFFLKVAFFL